MDIPSFNAHGKIVCKAEKKTKKHPSIQFSQLIRIVILDPCKLFVNHGSSHYNNTGKSSFLFCHIMCF